MLQLKKMLKRLKNPTTILSILSEIITILILLKVDVNVDLVTGIVTAVCSILVLLGIMSNPTTVTKGYGDDILYCKNCQEKTENVVINNELCCTKCGQKHEE